MPGDQRVDALSDERGRPYHGHRHARVGARGALGELLDFYEVADHAAVWFGIERRRLGERHRVVLVGAVNHRAGDEHDPPDPAGRRRRQHGLGATHVVGPPRRGVGVGICVEVGVDDDVDTR